MNKSLRLFIGLPLESVEADVLENIQDRLQSELDLPKKSLVRRSDFHLTLHFLGSVEETNIDLWRKALEKHAKQPSFSFSLNRLVAFPHVDRARVVALAGSSGASPLSHLFYQIGMTVEDLGLKTEKRVFVPHITLFRCRELKISKLSEIESPLEIRVSRFALFESKMGVQENRYRILKEYPCYS